MIKRNMKKIIISSLIVLLPMLIGIIFWNKLPDTLTTHWGADGVADGWSGKAFAVFGLPLMLFGFHWICVLATAFDKSNKNQNDKVFGIVLWILPVLSFFSNGAVYLSALDKDINLFLATPILLGFIFVLIGNYMPKCKQNSTIGVKIKWTLGNEENWNYTHRFAGKVWFVGGILVMFTVLLPLKIMPIVFLAVVFTLVFLPMLASWRYYKKQLKEGVELTAVNASKTAKTAKIITLIFVPVILVGVAFLMVTGNIEYTFEEECLSIEADYWGDLKIYYGDIDGVEYREEFDKGIRTYGFNSARLLMGIFENDEFGTYTLYSYTGEAAAVILDFDGEKLVLGGRDDDKIKAIYETLVSKVKG